MRRLRLPLLALAFTVSACKSAGAGATAESASARPAPRDPNRITGDQIQEAVANGVGNAYDLVVRLHPNWLQNRTRQAVSVYMDNQRYGGITTLRNVSLTSITSIRFMSSSEAQALLGLDNQGGAIVLSAR